MGPKEITEKHLTASVGVDFSAAKTANFLEQSRQAEKAFMYAQMYGVPNFAHPSASSPAPKWVPGRLISEYFRVDLLGRECLKFLRNGGTRIRALEYHADWSLHRFRNWSFENIAVSVTNIKPTTHPLRNPYLSDWKQPDPDRGTKTHRAIDTLRYGAPASMNPGSISVEDVDRNLILLMACGVQSYNNPQNKQGVVDAAFALATY